MVEGGAAQSKNDMSSESFFFISGISNFPPFFFWDFFGRVSFESPTFPPLFGTKIWIGHAKSTGAAEGSARCSRRIDRLQRGRWQLRTKSS